MRAHILGTCLVLGLAAAACAGPVASAAGEEPYLAAPGELLAPGRELRIQGHCEDPGAGVLTSAGLTNIQIRHDPAAGPPNLNASGVVAEDTTPGVYQVSMNCSGQTLSVTFTVVEPGDATADPPADFVSITPTSAAPGETVTVQARCDDTGDAMLRSPVLRAVTLAPDPEGHQPWAIHGTTTVTEDAEPGGYPVSMQCGEATVETTIMVLAGARHDGGPRNSGADQVSRVPRGAPETGEGPLDTSVPLLAVVLALGMAAGAGAIAWREVR
ncbi:MAG: hypothetical protein ACRDRP_16230 [Pseudonocardiaceae bacterium]